MMNYVWGSMVVIAVVCGVATGNLSALSDSIFTGAAQGVELWVTLLSMMILWSGLTAIMQQSGLSVKVAMALTPIMKWLFPELKNHPKAREAIAMNVAANLLGLGNAATPLGLKAMKELNIINGHGKIASNSMVMFVVLNSVSVQLIPTGLLVIRKQFGAGSPGDILPAIWLASITAAAFGAVLVALGNRRKGVRT